MNNTSMVIISFFTFDFPQFTHLDIKLTKMIFKKYTTGIFAYHSMCRDYIYLVPLFIDSTIKPQTRAKAHLIVQLGFGWIGLYSCRVVCKGYK